MLSPSSRPDQYNLKGELWKTLAIFNAYQDRPVADARVPIYPVRRTFQTAMVDEDVQDGFSTVAYIPGRTPTNTNAGTSTRERSPDSSSIPTRGRGWVIDFKLTNTSGTGRGTDNNTEQNRTKSWRGKRCDLIARGGFGKSKRKSELYCENMVIVTKKLDHVEAHLNYATDSDTGRKSVPIHDARAVLDQLSLEQQGFVLRRYKTAVTNFFDEKEVRAVYYPEVEQLLKETTGAVRAVAFEHDVRSAWKAERAVKGVRQPVKVVHDDYTEKSAPERVRLYLPQEAEALLKDR